MRHNQITAIAMAFAIMSFSAAPAYAAESAMDVICAPSGITTAADGSLLVTDTYNKLVWKVEDGKSTVAAGTKGVSDLYGEPIGGYNDSTLDQAFFKEPWAITPYLGGYAVSDSANNTVRLIDSSITRTAVGSPGAGFANGRGVRASFSNPTGLATDESGNLYIADTNNHAIRKVTPSGTVTTYAENLSEPTGLCYKNGSLYVAESGANRIVKLTNGAASVIAGNGSQGYLDGAAGTAEFAGPQGVAVSDDGIIYVSDTGNSAVRKIQDGTVTTMIASDPAALAPCPVEPRGLLVQGDKLYICDSFSRTLLEILR